MSTRDDSRLEIPRPRVIWADRGDPDAVSAGDQACLSFPPGLLRFLEADLGGGLKPGTGFAPRWILPLTAGASACYYLASPRGREALNSWMATRSRLAWARACGDGETVEARARIVRIGRASMRVRWRVESAAGRDLLAEGELILVSHGPSGTKRPVLRLHEPDARAAAEREPLPPGAQEPGPDAASSRTRARRWWPVPIPVRGLAARLGRRYRARRAARRTQPFAAARLEAAPASLVLAAGQSATVTVRAAALPAGLPAEVSAELPGGHGLDFAWTSDPRLRPPHTGDRIVEGVVTALRPDEVNHGSPWGLRFHLAVRGDRVRTADVSVAVPDPIPAEVYYVAGGRCPSPDAGDLASTADDLLAQTRALSTDGRSALYAAPARCEGTSAWERNASFERRLAECGGPGVRVVCAAGGGDDLDRHLQYVRALHPQVHVAPATEAVLAFLDYYTPHALAAALPPSHGRADGQLWQHPVRILGREIPITPQRPHRLQLRAAWWEPGDVREMVVLRAGVVIARLAPPGDEPPVIEFLAESHAGYELRLELHAAALERTPLRAPRWPPAAERSSVADAVRFLEWPRDPAFLLAAFEAPFVINSCRARQGPAAPGDSWSWVYPPRLLRLLYGPIGGGTEPLGRRAHPLGAIAAAATVHAAMEGLGVGWRPQRLAVRWRRPIDPQAGFLLQLRVCRCEAAEIDVQGRLEQPPAALADVSLTLRAEGAERGA